MAVLIVEDNRVSARITARNLERAGYEILVAGTGKEALEFLAGTRPVEIVISDIMMPEMDGLELLRAMKQRPEWRHIPVIFTTARTDLATVKKAASLGCKHYVAKPIQPAELLEKVRDAHEADKPVLRSREEAMAACGFDLKAYQETMVDFARLLDEKIQKIEGLNLAGSSESITLTLSDLLEGSARVGAERLARALAAAGVRNSKNPVYLPGHHCTALLGELKLLQRALAHPARSLGVWAHARDSRKT